MNNNTQIETVYEVAKRIFQEQNPQDGSCPLWAIKLSKEVANWQKQQDETKYKELLDNHNELLIALENSAEYLRNNKLYAQAQELINKAKNIKQQ